MKLLFHKIRNKSFIKYETRVPQYMKLMPPTEETIKAPVPFYVCTILRTDFIRLDRYHLPIGGFA